MDLKIALRDSNTASRRYVLVNPMLAKHLPVSPSRALDCFAQLAGRVAMTCKEERVLVIGFAETATALGAAVASVIGAVYVHTTREHVHSSREHLITEPVAEFFEEHSHAKNQAIYLSEQFGKLSSYDRIVFVEDEITTGKTILNFLKSVDYSGKITVSALVFNGLDDRAFSQYDAEFICLQKVDAQNLQLDGLPDPHLEHTHYLELDGLPDPRSGVDINEYHSKCFSLALQIIKAVNAIDVHDKNILVIGTEEFMYPALVLGRELENIAKSVKSQSTTRSPLALHESNGYPFYSKCSFMSVYDSARISYLYNLESYDTVIIYTDAPESDGMGLINAIRNYGNHTVYFVRVRHAY